MIYNTISQENDDHFYNAICAYVRGEPNEIVPGTVGEEQAEIAKCLFQDNPAVLDDKDRLLAEIASIHYRESGIEATKAWFVDRQKKHDDNLFADIVGYVRGHPHEIASGSNAETWAKQAKQLAAEDPTILDHQKRLLAATCYWSPSTEGESPEPDLSESPERWLVHNGRVNRDCISNAEYDRRMEERRAAGLLIDPSTAAIEWWYAQTLDPYGDGLPLLPEEDQVGREYFACALGSDIWVSVHDLPDTTRDAIRKRFDNTKGAILRIGIGGDGQLRITGFPPV